MKIALIDVGISKKAIESNMDVRHFFWIVENWLKNIKNQRKSMVHIVSKKL